MPRCRRTCPESDEQYKKPEARWTLEPPWKQAGPKLFELLQQLPPIFREGGVGPIMVALALSRGASRVCVAGSCRSQCRDPPINCLGRGAAGPPDHH